MKKILSIVLAFLLLFSLIACSNQTSTASPSASTAPSTSVPNGAAPSASAAAVQSAAASGNASAAPAFAGDYIPSPSPEHSSVGWYTDKVDWFARPAYKISFLYTMSFAITDTLSKALQDWGKRVNFTYSEYCSNNDNDAFLNTMQVDADQGVEGFILMADPTIGVRIKELASELKVQFMPAITAIYDEKDDLAYPQVSLGTKYEADLQTNWLADNYEKYWGNIDTSKLGYMCLTFSSNAQLKMVSDFANARFKELFPNNAKYCYDADCLNYGYDTNAGYNVASAIIAAHPEVQYWFITSVLEDYGQGAARAAESLSKEKTTLICSNGGNMLIPNWENGVYSTCWVSTVYYAQSIFAEPIVCGLIAMMDGRATPESLWPEWKAPGAKYANIICDTRVLTKDTYKDYLKYIDDYLAKK